MNEMLDIRVAYANAKVAMVIYGSDPDYRSDPEMACMAYSLLQDAWHAAERLGYQAGINDCDIEPPIMIHDEPDLVQSWREGWRSGAETLEMLNCDECQSGGDCRYHG